MMTLDLLLVPLLLWAQSVGALPLPIDTTGLPTTKPADARVVGSWTIVNGDYPLTNLYRDDGVMVQSVNGRRGEPMAYRIERDRLIVSIRQEDGKLSQNEERFEIKGDTITFFGDDGTKRVFRRSGR